MIPVYQTMSLANDGEGNCFNACIASVLELPLREVAAIHPKFEGDYWGAWNAWFGERGLKIEWRAARPDRPPPRGFAIASGRSSRLYPDDHAKAGERIHHAVVVFDGVLVHDPFPIAGGFSDIASYWLIKSLSEVERALVVARRLDLTA